MTTLDPDNNMPLYNITVGSVTPNLALYTHVVNWAGTEGQTLFTYNDDTVGGEPTGSSAEWAPYSGVLINVAPTTSESDAEDLTIPEQSVNGSVGLPMVGTVIATGGAGPYTFTLSDVPGGLAVDADGNITGTPNATAVTQCAVSVVDSNNTTATGTLSVMVA